MKFDGYVNTDFWNMTWLRRRARRVHLFHGVAGKYGLDAPVHIAPVVGSFDRLLFPNDDRLRRYREAGLVEPDGERGRLIGYPKVDCLVDGSLNRAAIQASLGLDPTVPTVLYAPTWSPQSSLNTIGAKLIPALARLDVNVVVKLHDRSYDRRSQTGGPVDWGHHLDAICRSWHVHAAHGSDVSPYLFVSDALVTDHSSVGFEFALLDRPIVVIDSPELLRNARVGADKIRALHSAATVVRDVDSATRAIVSSLAEPTRLSGERRAAGRPILLSPWKRDGSRRRLHLRAARAAGARRRPRLAGRIDARGSLGLLRASCLEDYSSCLTDSTRRTSSGYSALAGHGASPLPSPSRR